MLELLVKRLEAVSFEMTQAGNEYDGLAVEHAAMLLKALASAPAKMTARQALEAGLRSLESGHMWQAKG